MRGLVLFLLGCAWSTSAAASSSTSSALVLPVDGAGLLPTLRVELETGVRDALTASDEPKHRYTLTSREDTSAVLDDAGGAGLNCSLDEAYCLVRIGVIAGVDEVFAATAVTEGGAVQLRLTRVDVAGRAAVAIAAGVVVQPQQDDGQSIARVVARALAPTSGLTILGPAGLTVKWAGVVVGRLPLAAPLAVEPGTRDLQGLDGGRVVARTSVVVKPGAQTVTLTPEPQVTSTTSTTDPTTNPAPEPMPTLAVAGGVTSIVGALVAVTGGIGAAAVEADLGTPRPGKDDADDIAASRAAGIAFVSAAAVGVTAVVVGAALFVVETSEP